MYGLSWGNQGIVNYSNQHFDSFNAQGVVNLRNVKVSGNTFIEGKLAAFSCNFSSMHMHGFLEAIDTIVFQKNIFAEHENC